MKHGWLCVLAIAACSSGPSGEPAHGTATVMYGATSGKMVVGSAISDASMPANMVVQLGNDNVSCGTNLDNEFPPQGLYAYFSVDKTTPGTAANADVTVVNASGNNINVELSSGMVTIDSIDTRVMGSIMFTVMSQTDGTISVSGSFDVKKCF
jgi:hypothetical protein